MGLAVVGVTTAGVVAVALIEETRGARTLVVWVTVVVVTTWWACARRGGVHICWCPAMTTRAVGWWVPVVLPPGLTPVARQVVARVELVRVPHEVRVTLVAARRRWWTFWRCVATVTIMMVRRRIRMGHR